MATLQNIGKLKYRGKDGLWHPLPVVVQDAGGGVSTISGKGAPTSETQGEVNQLYRDEDTQRLYICTATDGGGYTWAAVVSDTEDAVTYTAQTLTNAQKTQARANIGAGTSNFSGSYNDLSNKPNIPVATVIDTTLTKSGQAADAKAAGDAIGKKIDKAQGTENAGKILGIGADGNVTPQDKPVQALCGPSAPTTATAGVVGQEYYVIVNNAVTEMYVCTATENGTYTWYRVEFGAEETDPTVPSWAKEAQKPSYTASEVGADPSGTAASQVSAHNTGTDTHSDIRLLISGLTDRLNALADSDDTTLDQLSEIVAYIKSNRDLIDAVTTSKVSVTDIVNDLTTNAANKPLSAAQGVVLKALIDAITIPTALPNPNALTLTGAVSATYDGSAPVSVDIPSGGGNKGWTLLYDGTITIEEAVKTVTVSLLVPCDGMVDFIGYIKWTANANTENANDNISIRVGEAEMGYGRIGDPSDAGNSVFQAPVTSSYTYFGRATYIHDLSHNLSNMQYGLNKNAKNANYENVTINFFSKTYAGNITLLLYGR